MAGRPPGARAVRRPTLRSGPVVLRPVRATPCCNNVALIIIHADGTRGGLGFYLRYFVRMFVFFRHDISKTDAARITKIDIKMFHHESWKPIYFRIKMSKVKGKPSAADVCSQRQYCVMSEDRHRFVCA